MAEEMAEDAENAASESPYIFFLFVYVILLVLALVSALTHTAIVLHQRKQHFPAMLTTLKNDLHHDAKFIKWLWTFDKVTLNYRLLSVPLSLVVLREPRRINCWRLAEDWAISSSGRHINFCRNIASGG